MDISSEMAPATALGTCPAIPTCTNAIPRPNKRYWCTHARIHSSATTTTCGATPACFVYNSESTTSISTAISVPPHFLFILSHSLIGRTCRKRCSATVHNAGAPPHTASRSTLPPCGGRHLSCPPSRHHIPFPSRRRDVTRHPSSPLIPAGRLFPPLHSDLYPASQTDIEHLKCLPAAVSTDACL